MKRIAVLIGVSNYDGTGLSNLEGVNNDISKLAKAILPAFDRVVTLTNVDLDGNQVVSATSNHLNDNDSLTKLSFSDVTFVTSYLNNIEGLFGDNDFDRYNDLLWVHFSGHGNQHESTWVLRVPGDEYDSQPDKEPKGSQERRDKILSLDKCFTDGFLRNWFHKNFLKKTVDEQGEQIEPPELCGKVLVTISACRIVESMGKTETTFKAEKGMCIIGSEVGKEVLLQPGQTSDLVTHILDAIQEYVEIKERNDGFMISQLAEKLKNNYPQITQEQVSASDIGSTILIPHDKLKPGTHDVLFVNVCNIDGQERDQIEFSNVAQLGVGARFANKYKTWNSTEELQRVFKSPTNKNSKSIDIPLLLYWSGNTRTVGFHLFINDNESIRLEEFTKYLEEADYRTIILWLDCLLTKHDIECLEKIYEKNSKQKKVYVITTYCDDRSERLIQHFNKFIEQWNTGDHSNIKSVIDAINIPYVEVYPICTQQKTTPKTTPVLPLKDYLETGGRLDYPDLVDWDISEQPYCISKFRPRKIFLVLGIKPEDFDKQGSTWSDVYDYAFTYYHQGYATFAIYDNTFAVIKTIFSHFSNYIRNRLRDIDSVKIIVCGEYVIEDDRVYFSDLKTEKQPFLDDLAHDLRITDRKEWVVFLRSTISQIQSLSNPWKGSFEIRHEDIGTSILAQIYDPIKLKYPKEISFRLCRVIPGGSPVTFSQPLDDKYWHEITALTTSEIDQETFNHIWVIVLILGLANPFTENKDAIIKEIIWRSKMKRPRFNNSVKPLTLLTCWSVIQWKYALLEEEKTKVYEDLLEYTSDLSTDIAWNRVINSIDRRICYQAFLDLIKNIPKDKLIAWYGLTYIINRIHVDKNAGKEWREMSISLLNQLMEKDRQLTEIQRLADKVEGIEGAMKNLATTASLATAIAEAIEDLATTKFVTDKITEKTQDLATKREMDADIAKATADIVTTKFVTEEITKATVDIATTKFVTEEITKATTDLVTKPDITVITNNIDTHTKRISDLFLLLITFIIILAIIFMFFIGILFVIMRLLSYYQN